MSSDQQPTAVIPDPAQPAPPERKPRRRGLRVALVLIGILVLLVVAAVIADIALRSYAESETESQISEQLPEAVEGDVDVTIGGFSFLAQVITGTIGEVQLDAPQLTVNGVPLEAHATARDVPTDLTKPIGDIQAAISIDQAAVNEIVDIPGDATLELGDGDVSYLGTISLFGLKLGYQVTGTVAATAGGDEVEIDPQSASLTQGAADVDIDLKELLGSLADDPITVCVAQYLPEGATVDSLDVVPGGATAHLSAKDFVLDEDSLNTLGSCS